MVEQLAVNQLVGGSNPSRGARFGSIMFMFSYLNGLRGLAAIFILTTHSPFVGAWLINRNHGYLGVDLFSLISGFVVYLSYCRSHSLKEYYISRIIRIYSVILPLCTIMFLIDNHFLSLRALISFISFSGGHYPSWSLRNEAIFYIFLPLVACVFAYLNKLPKLCNIYYLLIIISTILYLSWFYFFVCNISMGAPSPTTPNLRSGGLDYWAGDGFLVHFVKHGGGFERMLSPFLLGMLAARLNLDYKRISFGAKINGYIVDISMLLSYFILDLQWYFIHNKMNDYAIIPVLILFTTLFLMKDIEQSSFIKFLSTPLMQFLGKISFSMYVCHAFLIERYFVKYIYPAPAYISELHKGILIYSITILISTVCWYIFENKVYQFLKLKLISK